MAQDEVLIDDNDGDDELGAFCYRRLYYYGLLWVCDNFAAGDDDYDDDRERFYVD